jgi:hypothetical protein
MDSESHGLLGSLTPASPVEVVSLFQGNGSDLILEKGHIAAISQSRLMSDPILLYGSRSLLFVALERTRLPALLSVTFDGNARM